MYQLKVRDIKQFVRSFQVMESKLIFVVLMVIAPNWTTLPLRLGDNGVSSSVGTWYTHNLPSCIVLAVTTTNSSSQTYTQYLFCPSIKYLVFQCKCILSKSWIPLTLLSITEAGRPHLLTCIIVYQVNAWAFITEGWVEMQVGALTQ